MAKVNAKKRNCSAKPEHLKYTKRNDIVNGKRKYWIKLAIHNKLPPKVEDQEKKAQTQQISPPTDALQFSSNWKTLQEVRVHSCSMVINVYMSH